jgi:hypothetical protein
MERDHLEDLGLDGRINIKAGIQDMGWGGLMWLSIGTGVGRFHKIRRISSLVEDLLASQEGLCSKELLTSVFRQALFLRAFAILFL